MHSSIPARDRFALPPFPAVLASVVIVQGGAALAKGIFPVLGAANTAGMRIALSAAMLLVAFRPGLRQVTAAQWRAVVPYGVALGAMNLLFYLALARVPLGLAVTLEFIGPLSVAVAYSRRPLDIVWVLMALLGIALIAPWQARGIDPLGATLALAAAACWAAYIVLGGRLARVMRGGAAVSVGMLVATGSIAPIAFAGGGVPHLTPSLIGTSILVALLSSALPYTFEMQALRTMPAKTFSIIMSLEPAVAALCGMLFLGEILSPTQWTSVALVIAASVGAAITARAGAGTQ